MNAESTLTKQFLNEKVEMVEAEYEAKHVTDRSHPQKEKEDLCGEVLLLRWALQGTINPIKMMCLILSLTMV